MTAMVSSEELVPPELDILDNTSPNGGREGVAVVVFLGRLFLRRRRACLEDGEAKEREAENEGGSADDDGRFWRCSFHSRPQNRQFGPSILELGLHASSQNPSWLSMPQPRLSIFPTFTAAFGF